MKIVQLAATQRGATAKLAQQSGICCRAAPKHKTLGTRNQTYILRAENISVIAAWRRALRSYCKIGIGVGGSRVHSGACPGMNYQLGNRIFVIQLKYCSEFINRVKPHAGFYGYSYRAARKDIRQHTIKRPGIGKRTAALMLCDDCSRWAAKVEIDLRIAHVGKLACSSKERFGAIAENLRYKRQPGVVFRQDIPHGRHSEIAGAVRSNKWGKVLVRTRKKF